MFDYLQFRYRRQLRRLQRTGRNSRRATNTYLQKHIWGKWHQLRLVRRLLFVWWGLAVVSLIGIGLQVGYLNNIAQKMVAEPGGTYTEALVGSVRVLNPVLPESAVSADINKLVFSGLTRYNEQRKITSDLAESWEASNDGRTYTFELRKDVYWHDGVPFTADDVVFTLAAIQNPDTRSPLAPSWKGVKAEAKGSHTVVYTLPNPLSSFVDSTVVGILPRHLLESVDPASLRVAAFNQKPIGTGPFKIKAFAPSANEVTLESYSKYHFGEPKLDEFVFRLYEQPQDALAAYAKRQVMGISRVKPEQLEEAKRLNEIELRNLALPQAQVMFFRMGDPLAADKELRNILIRSLDRPAIVKAATAGEAQALQQPLLPGQLGYTNEFAPAKLSGAEANTSLTTAGWVKQGDGRKKGDKVLKFTVVTLKDSELEQSALEIARQWGKLGVELDIKAVSLNELQQSHVRPRQYQLLLIGTNIGADPDVYPYWHSSQTADPGLNLSEYKSTPADRSLEAGRINTEKDLRKAKYTAFLKTWNSDLPAAVLYQPVYIYAQNSGVGGMKAKLIVTPDDRFYEVHNWTVLERSIPRTW